MKRLALALVLLVGLGLGGCDQIESENECFDALAGDPCTEQ